MLWLPSINRQVGRKYSKAFNRPAVVPWLWPSTYPNSPSKVKCVARQDLVQSGPAAGAMQQHRRRDEADDGDEQADHDIHVSDRGHAGDGRKHDHEDGDDVGAGLVIHLGEDQMKDVAAGAKLIRSNRGISEEDCDGGEDAGGGVVACFHEVGDGVLRELARARRDKVDDQQPDPSAGGLPQAREAVTEGVFGAGKQAARADPGREQRGHEHIGRERPTCDEVVGLGFYFAKLRDG